MTPLSDYIVSRIAHTPLFILPRYHYRYTTARHSRRVPTFLTLCIDKGTAVVMHLDIRKHIIKLIPKYEPSWLNIALAARRDVCIAQKQEFTDFVFFVEGRVALVIARERLQEFYVFNYDTEQLELVRRVVLPI